MGKAFNATRGEICLSFETNEFAIDYNAALLSLLGRLIPPTRAAETGIVDRILRWLGL